MGMLGDALENLLTGNQSTSQVDDPNWTEVKEFDFGDKEYKPTEGTTKSALGFINSAKLSEDQRKAFGEFYRNDEKRTLEEAGAAWKGKREQWAKEAKEALGDKGTETVEAANKVLESFGKDAIEMIKESGLSNRVEFVRFLAAVAEKLPKDGSSAGGDDKGGKGGLADRPEVRLFASRS